MSTQHNSTPPPNPNQALWERGDFDLFGAQNAHPDPDGPTIPATFRRLEVAC